MKKSLFGFLVVQFVFFSLFSLGTPQEDLHQAILDNSGEGIESAIQKGASLTLGKGNQPPLLLAALLNHATAIDALLEEGASPNITHLGKSFVLYALGMGKYETARLLLKKGVNFSQRENEIEEAIKLLMLRNPFDTETIELLDLLGYDIKDNFRSTDLTKNKWYILLGHHFMGTRHGRPFGYSGLPSAQQVLFFLQNGANPNQVFSLPDGTTWTPLLLIIQNYVEGLNQRRMNIGYLDSNFNKLIEILLEYGANINQTAKPDSVPYSQQDSPLSFAMLQSTFSRNPKDQRKVREEYCFLIDMLIKKGASLETAMELFVKNTGKSNHKIVLPNRRHASLLTLAIEKDNAKLVKYLLETGAYSTEWLDPCPESPYLELRTNKYTPLKLAILMGNDDIIELLIKHGARA